eukprot:6698633-Heterocapsa_arctica.AAC.1
MTVPKPSGDNPVLKDARERAILRLVRQSREKGSVLGLNRREQLSILRTETVAARTPERLNMTDAPLGAWIAVLLD